MKRIVPFLLVIMIACYCQDKSGTAVVSNLKCEYLSHPIGIDSKNPRFTWKIKSSQYGVEQIAYRIIVSEDSLTNSRSRCWDTGKVYSDENLVAYNGTPLQPFTRYFWSIQVWDNAGFNSASSASTFETGMMNIANWQGSWISDTRDIDLKPAPYFRKKFTVQKNIKTARAYVAVAGLFELSLNGTQIGNHRLDPMYTRYDRRTLYVTHDVTAPLVEGENVLGVLLGNGWYNHQSTAVWYFHEAPWRGRPTLCLDLRIEYEDGTIEIIRSDNSWKSSLSPIIFNSIYTAEHYDARLEQNRWNMLDFDDSEWNQAILTPAPSKNIVAQSLQPIRNVEKIVPLSMNKINNRTYVFDLGRNISGVSQLTVNGLQGTKIELIHGELLDENERVDLSNIDVHYRPTDDSDPFQTDIFILSGAGVESFMPRFNYKGFQYIEVKSSRPLDLTKNSLIGYFMHSDVPAIGKIESSNPTMNKIWSAGNNSYLSNLFGYPTDCPQREKNGWTGDAHIAIETGLYSFDAITIYEKWLADHRDEQQPNGVLPAIIPTDGWGYHWANGPDWTSTIALIPWNVYLFYGDTKILEDNYENIKRYVDHIEDSYPSGLTDWGLGDWVPVKSRAPKELTSSVYYYTDALILSKSADILGHKNDKKKYLLLTEKIKNAINAKYLNEETGLYGSGMQTELSVPLHRGIVPKNSVEKVAANLAQKVEEDNFHIDVGLLGSKAILNALSEHGYADIAYKVASQETYPSWGWWIVNGATTFYENWDISAKQDLSLNHIMFGEINAWMYKALGGIKPDPDQPGFKHVLLKPHFVDGLDSFHAEHVGPHGKIISSWIRKDNQVSYTITIPTNSSANVWLKGKNIFCDGKSIEECPHVEDTNKNDDEYQIQIKSGTYDIIIEN